MYYYKNTLKHDETLENDFVNSTFIAITLIVDQKLSFIISFTIFLSITYMCIVITVIFKSVISLFNLSLKFIIAQYNTYKKEYEIIDKNVVITIVLNVIECYGNYTRDG